RRLPGRCPRRARYPDRRGRAARRGRLGHEPSWPLRVDSRGRSPRPGRQLYLPGGRPPRGPPRAWEGCPPPHSPPAGYRLGLDVRGYVEANASEFIDDLKQWLTIPSISDDPARHGDVGHSAAWLAGHLRGAGFPVAQVLDTGG